MQDVCSTSAAVSEEGQLLKVESVSEQEDRSGMADEGLGHTKEHIGSESRA
jgi:hypothetical protein